MSKSSRPFIHTETLEETLEELADYLIEGEGFNILSEQGRDLRWGILASNGFLDPIPPELLINDDNPTVDIFGQVLSKKPNFECECPKCNRMLAAARFAPHLEKCMGMGRNSSRIASRRLAATGSNSASVALSDVTSASSRSSVASNSSGASSTQIGELPSEDEHFEEDMDDDEDWTMDRKKKTVKKSSEKSTPKRKGPVSRIKNVEARGKRGGSPSVSVTSSPASSIVDAGIEDDSLDPLSLP